MNYRQVGVSRPRSDAKQQVTGQIEFVGDMYLPGMLYAKPLLSSEHHARILTLDTSQAERLPGVRAIATAKDVPNNITGQILLDQPVFAADKVRHRGEPIALVAADAEEIAQQAVELIKVEFERLPAVFEAREALQPGAPIVHEEAQGKLCKGNVVLYRGHDCLRLAHGDVAKGFAEADVIVEESFSTCTQRSLAIEPFAYLAKPESTGKITVWANTQSPFLVSDLLAPILRLPLNMVRVISPAVGGGFGQKGMMMLEPNVAVLALKAGRPVRWALNMAEMFELGPAKAPHYSTYKLGVKKDGSLTALHRTHIVNVGAYASLSCLTGKKCTMLGSGPYRIPNQLGETLLVYTNKVQSGPFRGFGMSQPTVAFEAMMDIAAERLGMDPLDFRLKNALVDGDFTGTGQILHSVGMKATYEKVRERSGWDQRNKRAQTASVGD